MADDASLTPDDDESDADAAQEDGDTAPDPDAGGDELTPDDAATDAAIDGDGSEQTEDDASTPDATSPDDSGGADEDAQTADAGPTCDQNLADCNGDGADGCEVDTTSSAQHCSGCGQACALSNAVPMCVASSCAVASCAPSFGNCNGDPADGCEVSTASDVRHCGGCNMPCAARPNATSACANNNCVLGACTAGFRDCNVTVSDGCEININTDARHCGGCGMACTLANATPGCTGQRCTIAACSPGFRDCDFSASNGCEIDTRSNRLHCGGCNLPCAAGQQCSNSTCT